MTIPLPELRSALADRYEVEEELGRGGMAVVFAARDRRHDRRVAVKVLRAEYATAVGAARFLREIQLAGKLQHPHIVPIYDSGERGGYLYYVMPLIDGDSLRERLEREGQLPVPEAVRYVRDILEALDVAHGNGVVHRDIKPENILLSGGHALVADFGIARAISAAGGDKLTETGLAIGTPAYMSVEQAAGGAVDGRTDIYSLGCVLYEMLAGSPPFTGHNAQAIISRHLIDPVPSVRTVRATVPAALETVIVRSMAKAPADRFASAADLVKALAPFDAATLETGHRPVGVGGSRRRRWAALAAGLAIMVAGFLVFQTLTSERSAGREIRLLVLPFQETGSPDDEWLGEALAVVMRDRLRVGGVSVLGRWAAQHAAATDRSVVELGRELNVDYILDGTVDASRRPDGQLEIRLAPELTRTSDGVLAWSSVLSGVMADAVHFPENVTAQIVGELNIALTRAQRRRLVAGGTSNPEAYQLYMRGLSFWHERTPTDIGRAIDAFELALSLDSGFALAHAGLADAYVIAATYGITDANVAYPRAEQYARAALAIDDGLGEAYAALGALYDNYYYQTDSAVHFLRTAIALDPGNGTAHSYLAIRHAQRADSARALEEISRARALDPMSPIITAHYAGFHALTGRPEIGLPIGEALVRDAPQLIWTYAYLGLGYEASGAPERAVAITEMAAERFQHPWFYAMLVGLYQRRGRTDEARGALRALRAVPEQPDKAYSLASALAALGRAEDAFHALDVAFDTYSPLLRWLKVEPNWQTVRTDPRYAAALVRRGF